MAELTAEEKKALIAERQLDIRQWFEAHAKDSHFQMWMSDPDGALRQPVYRWMKMHLRLAQTDDGALLLDENVWDSVKEQIAHSPFDIANQVSVTILLGVSDNMLRRYHVIDKSAGDGKWTLQISRLANLTRRLMDPDHEKPWTLLRLW